MENGDNLGGYVHKCIKWVIPSRGIHVLMYDDFFNNLKKKSVEGDNLLYMDTDSFILKINAEEIYKDMSQDAGIYDTSNYKSDKKTILHKE